MLVDKLCLDARPEMPRVAGLARCPTLSQTGTGCTLTPSIGAKVIIALLPMSTTQVIGRVAAHTEGPAMDHDGALRKSLS